MKKICFLLLIGVLVSCQEQSEKQSFPKELGAISQNLDGYFTALTELEKFNGVVLAYKNDSLILEKAYKLYESPDSSTHVEVDHQFDIHSISKLMAHYLIADLRAQGNLSLDQTIDAFYPNFPRGSQITIEMLLHHRSGLPRELVGFEKNEFDLSSRAIIELAKMQPLQFEPGTDVQYSNVGYEIIYDILSRIYKKSFAQCVMDEIFIPLNMTHSGAHFFTKEDRIQKLAKNHTLKDSLIVRVSNIREDEFKTARLFATAADLGLFLQEVEKEPFRTALANEKEVIAKDGGSDGIRAQIYTDLPDDFAFVLLANYDEIPFVKTIEDVVKIFSSEEVKFPEEMNRKSVELPEEILEKYAGSYTFADFDGLVLRIAVEKNHLLVYQEGEKIGTLRAESETVFFEDPKAAESFEFVKNESGSYDALMGWKGIVVEGKRQ